MGLRDEAWETFDEDAPTWPRIRRITDIPSVCEDRPLPRLHPDDPSLELLVEGVYARRGR